jgi:hypothetical protein
MGIRDDIAGSDFGEVLMGMDPGNMLGLKKPDLSGLQGAQDRAFGTQDRLAAERGGFVGRADPAWDQAFRLAQGKNIYDLQQAAAGKVPSPAEIQLQRQAGVNAARQFGLAAALQGRNPGAAMRSARLGSLATQAGTNVDAAMLRAAEQNQARNALVQAIAAGRAGELGLLGADTDWRKALLGGEIGALDAGGKAAGAFADAATKAQGADNVLKGGLIQGAGSIISDEREKTDVKPANLEKLADAMKGFRFRYKDQANGEGERVGFMAQDALRGGPIGKGMVKTRRDGKLSIDVGNAVGAAVAMSAQALREAKKPLVQLRKAA